MDSLAASCTNVLKHFFVHNIPDWRFQKCISIIVNNYIESIKIAQPAGTHLPGICSEIFPAPEMVFDEILIPWSGHLV